MPVKEKIGVLYRTKLVPSVNTFHS
jgi:hypothetical protein